MMFEILSDEEITEYFEAGCSTHDIATSQRDKTLREVIEDLRDESTHYPYVSTQRLLLLGKADEYERQVSNGEDS